ncbi:MAG: hypothetical protein ACC707_11505 [Thiohalomonadales bacterium]
MRSTNNFIDTLNPQSLLFSYIATIIFLSLPTVVLAEEQLSGNVALEYKWFQNNPLREWQHRNNVAGSAELEYYRDWDKGKQSLLFSPFVRIDQHDSERTHADIRDLSWQMVSRDWELRAGIKKVFWGVTESQHLVDFINQTDALEGLDGEDKLGQPMLNFALIKDWGTLDFFVLPYFRARQFLGQQSRLSFPVFIDQDNSQYESADAEQHVDFAIRWSHSIDDWDIGLSHFSGTNRNPIFIPKDSTTLIPYYNLIEQTGLELQAIYGDWLLKLEAIARKEYSHRTTAFTVGFENTLVGIFESQIDLGLLAEYLYDDRYGKFLTPFDNDLFVAARLALNDAQGSELLAGFFIDLDNQTRLFNIEASRRLGDSWKLNIEARFFSNIDSKELFYTFRQDDYLQAELAWYF